MIVCVGAEDMDRAEVAVTEPGMCSMGSRRKYDRTATDGSWEVIGYDGADDVDREECTEEGGDNGV